MTKPIIVGTVAPVRSAAADAQLIVLGPSLGTTTALWDDVVPSLAQNFRVLRYDLPGHGSSPATTEPFSIVDAAASVIALVDSIGGGSFHYAGISMGGAIGLALALHYPERVLSLGVICSGAKIGTPESWWERAALVRSSGTAATVAGSATRWFAPDFLEREPDRGGAALKKLLDVDDESYALCCEALSRFDVTAEVSAITASTLCISGEFDVSTPTAQLQELAALIPAARHVMVTGVGHLPAIEKPDAVATLILDYLVTAAQPAGSRTAATAHAEGMAVRRAVLGDRHVDAANAAITPETSDFQDFITRYAWGEIWTRPGLDRRTRSFLTLACLVTGGHESELEMHVRAAITNGLSREEISEALLHTAIYAGVPAANSAFAVARSTFASLDAAAIDAAASESAPG